MLEEKGRYHDGDSNLPTETNSTSTQSSTGAGTSTSGTHFVCSRWVLRISIKRMKYLAYQFYLSSTLHKPGPTERPHLFHPRMMVFSEAIIREGASFPDTMKFYIMISHVYLSYLGFI